MTSSESQPETPQRQKLGHSSLDKAMANLTETDRMVDVDPLDPLDQLDPLKQDLVNETTINKITTDQNLNDQRLNDQKLNDQKLNDQKLNDQNVDNLETNNQNFVDPLHPNTHQNTINENTVNQNTINQNILHATPDLDQLRTHLAQFSRHIDVQSDPQLHSLISASSFDSPQSVTTDPSVNSSSETPTKVPLHPPEFLQGDSRNFKEVSAPENLPKLTFLDVDEHYSDSDGVRDTTSAMFYSSALDSEAGQSIRYNSLDLPKLGSLDGGSAPFSANSASFSTGSASFSADSVGLRTGRSRASSKTPQSLTMSSLSVSPTPSLTGSPAGSVSLSTSSKPKKNLRRKSRNSEVNSERSHKSEFQSSGGGYTQTPTSGKIFRNMLILEESLRQQVIHQRTLRRKYLTFLSVLCSMIASISHHLYFSDYTGLLRVLLQLILLMLVVTLFLYHLSGEYQKTIVLPRRFLSSTNKGLRQLNIRLVKIKTSFSDSCADLTREFGLFLCTMGLKFFHTAFPSIKGNPNSRLETWLVSGQLRCQPRFGINDVKLVLFPRSFSTNLREGWELYRNEFWVNEGMRRRQKLLSFTRPQEKKVKKGSSPVAQTQTQKERRKRRSSTPQKPNLSEMNLKQLNSLSPTEST